MHALTLPGRPLAAWLLAAFASAFVGCTVPASDDEMDVVAESTESALDRARARVLPFQYQIQETRWWCGPAATRIALSASISPPSQAQLAKDLGTTTAGTNNIGIVTKVMNEYVGDYQTRWLPNDPALALQKKALWDDIVRSIDGGHAVVANIVAPPWNHPVGYPNDRTVFHYIALLGYSPTTREVFVGDSAYFSNIKSYWISFDKLATLIPPKGYSAWFPRGTTCPGFRGLVIGDIEKKYSALGGCQGVLGGPLTNELGTANGVGRFNDFEHGAIYWTAASGAFEIYGDIYDRYVAHGRETGALGLPVSGEYEIPGGRRSDFEHGSITWDAATRQTTVVGL